MNLSRRGRRDLRIILWAGISSAVVSAWFSVSVSQSDEPTMRAVVRGVLASLMIATPITLFELRSAYPGFLRRLRRLPLAVYFAIKLLFYFIVIVGGLVTLRLLMPLPSGGFDTLFRTSILFAIGMSVVGTLTFEIGGLLGFGTLKNFVTGRYVQPRREQKAFLLIDMKDSTGLAERLGPVRFHELLNDFSRDVADAALECQAEIHKYVGDEAILTWPADRTLADGDCLACPFIARDLIAAHGDTYRSRYGAVPEFRAALHCGEIVAGEIGAMRREIAYVGDTLNVAARLLDAAKALGHDVLVSADLLAQAKLPTGVHAETLPMLAVRGRTAPLGISALECSGSAIPHH